MHIHTELLVAPVAEAVSDVLDSGAHASVAGERLPFRAPAFVLAKPKEVLGCRRVVVCRPRVQTPAA